MGDVNFDDSVNSKDTKNYLEYLIGTYTLPRHVSLWRSFYLDVNGDNECDILDTAALEKKIEFEKIVGKNAKT